MRWFTTSCLMLFLTIASTSADWSWGDKEDASKDKANVDLQTDLLEGESIDKEETAQPKSWQTSNDTVLDEIVDELVNQKQGRSLGFDDVYSDPQIKEALDSGKDASAKDLIKTRLCDLGLIQCEDEDVQEKRYFSPDELIYAQPVDIKPVGQPVASIPIRGPPRAYGPAKPMPQHYTRPQKTQPPKRIGYGSSPIYGRPGFSEKYGVAGNNNFQFAQSNALYGGQDSNYVTRPPQYSHENPYAFENTKPGFNKVPPTSKPQTVVQQHVHHHYVHEDNKDPKVIIKPVGIPVGSVGNLVSQGLPQQTPEIITGPGGDYSGFVSNGFKPMTASYNLDNSDTIYGSQKPNSNNFYTGQNGLGNFGSQSNDFYKKEFNVGSSANSLYNQGPAVFSQNQNNAYQQGFHEPKAQDFDCVCVNFDQCPSEEIIGRRDDLYLPIDPRNKGSDIAALTDEQAENLNATETTELHAIKTENATVTEAKKLSKREVKEENSEDSAKQAEPRLIGLAGYGGYGGNGNKKVQPTFGVSFGLPQPSHGGYPINPFNSNPLYNPYGPALNGGGLNLGLVSVNPLLAVQVSKNDYGEKVVKPFVNLHVTPNEHVVNKLGHLFHEKKQYLFNKHEHYHHYNPHGHHYNPHGHGHHYHGFHEKPLIHPSYGPPAHYVPHHIPPYPLPHHPPHIGPPPYSPHFTHYQPAHFKHHPLETGPGNDDYYDDDNDNNSYDNNADYNPHQGGYYNPGFERSANLSANSKQGYANRFAYSRSFTLPTHNPGANREGQTVRFPENRKKREVVEKPVTETVEERQFYGGRPQTQQCRQNQVCCRRPLAPQASNKGQCGVRHSQGINGRIKTPSYVDGDSEFGEYPWQAAILKKDPKESIYACGGTLIDNFHIVTAAHCIKSFKAFELRVRLGEWDVNHDVEFYPYIERDVVSVHIHPLYYAGTLDNDLAILKMDRAVEWNVYPHISPACLPDKYTDYAGQRCWTTGWGKDAFGDFGKYQNILKEVDVPILGHNQCQQQLRQTRLGYNYELNKGFLCAGGEEGKDACKGDGGGPLVCERGGTWQLVGVVSWGIGCGQAGVPGVYVKVAHYLDWISQITGKFSPY